MKMKFSAGGVVYKYTDTKSLLILLGKHSQYHQWVFPKGLIGDKIENEGKEETAVREVEEETGIFGEIIKDLTPVTYWYVWEGEKIKKTVYYFLMEFISADTSKKDEEMEDVQWFSPEEVDTILTYSSDKKVWAEAKKILL